MTRRLLFVLPDLAVGGAQPMNVNLARRLQQNGWEVRLAVLFDRPQAVAEALLDGLPVTRLRSRGAIGKGAALVRLARLAKEADVVIGGMEFAATNYGYLAARMARRPFLSWMHTAFERHQFSAEVFDRLVSHWVYRRCTDVVFPSAGARDSLRLALGEKPVHAHWRVIENFVALPLPSGHIPHPQAYGKPVVIAVGRLVHVKAFDRLIRAHAALRAQGLEQHLVLLGDGPLREALIAQAKTLGVQDTVFMPGHVENVTDWLAHATVFALCSRYEGLPLVLLEALAAGLPAMAMDCPSGPREILRDGRVGRLVPADDEAAFTRALAEMLRDPKQRAYFAELGKRRARDYTAERIVPRWEALLEDILTRDAHGK